MAADLIARAAQRSKQSAGPDVIAWAAHRAAEGRETAVGGTLDALRPEGREHRQPDPGAGMRPNGDAARQRPRARTEIQTIDWARLQANGGLIPHGEPNRLTEEFRIIKQPLIARANRKAPDDTSRRNIIMVTSARPREGKTYVAINLAMSLASERGLNVLLIDADCHRPAVLDRLGLVAERGLFDVLKDSELDLAEVLVRTDCPNLSILPSGQRVPESTEILASQEMEAMMGAISTRYSDRIIIIDTPPVLATSEASVLARHVGQVVFVVEANATGAAVVHEACTLLACKDLSIVLNKRLVEGNNTDFGGYYD